MFWIFNLLILIQFSVSGVPSTPEDFVRKNRMILIDGEGDCSAWFTDELQKDLSERKLLVMHFNNGALIESNFKGELKATAFLKLIPEKADQSMNWVLIGLDGGIKSSGVSLPKSGEIFKIIDAMPMRQSELVKKGNQDNSLN